MKAFIFDTETTGLIKNRSRSLDDQPEVIEFFGHLYDLKKDKPIKEFETLIKPSKFPMTDQIIKDTKTKLSNDMLKDAPSFAEVAPNIKKLIEAGPTDKYLCTIEQTMHIKGFRLNLTRLHEHLFDGQSFSDAHRARSDVDALTRCCVKLYQQGCF
jgi:inhibitor of KinA sporulation pathway (predicted exonuclease)